MTPKEKAEELVDKIQLHYPNTITFPQAKKCALIAVDEVLEECLYFKDWFWEEVKQEIEKL